MTTDNVRQELDHFISLSPIDMIYAFGSNGSGQLGICHNQDTASPQLCRFNDSSEDRSKTQRIVAGGNHTLILLESGQLYFTGSNIDGRAGLAYLGHTVDQFHQVNLGLPIVKLCSALWEASVVVTLTDQVFTFGRGAKGELGTGKTVAPAPCKLPDFPPPGEGIVDVASGVSHTVVVLSSGDVWGWGNGRKGQLGAPTGIVPMARKIQGLEFRVLRAVCGREFTYLVGDAQEGHHAVLGINKWNIKSSVPPSISGWKDIGASWGSIFVLKISGQIESWGRNDHGQLAPSDLPVIEKMAVGSEHVLALTKDRKVLSWGWGEHGNCGPSTPESEDVRGPWNVITTPFGDNVIQDLAAGCATSFIQTSISHCDS